MTKTWTPAQRAITALTLGKPDEIPTFELEFQLSRDFYGYSLWEGRLEGAERHKYSDLEAERIAVELADKYARVFGNKTALELGPSFCCGDEEKDSRPGLDYAIVTVHTPEWRDTDSVITKAFRRRLREHFGDTRLLACYGDGTIGIPQSGQLYDFVYQIADEPEEVLAFARRKADAAIALNHRQHAAGIDVALVCTDYCYNSGPFLSPAMFDEFVTPFLSDICREGRNDGMYMIKHTDGNIMPIISSLVEAGPHALHSLDPMAGVDIRQVKLLYGDRVALCGNVNCAALSAGTDEEVIASTEYCLKYGAEGGGYIFATSNCAFKGIPAHRYQMILDMWKQRRKY